MAGVRVVKPQDVGSFVKELTGALENKKAEIKESLDWIEGEIREHSYRIVPYSTGQTQESYFQRIDEDEESIALIVGYDEAGEHSDYIPLIHEYKPVDGGYGADDFIPKDYYRPDHAPQTQFLRVPLDEGYFKVIKDLEGKMKK